MGKELMYKGVVFQSEEHIQSAKRIIANSELEGYEPSKEVVQSIADILSNQKTTQQLINRLKNKYNN